MCKFQTDVLFVLTYIKIESVIKCFNSSNTETLIVQEISHNSVRKHYDIKFAYFVVYYNVLHT